MKIIEKIAGLFTCGKGDGTIKLNNRLVQEDLIHFLNSDLTDFVMAFTPRKFEIVRRVFEEDVDSVSTISYPYETKEDMENDYLELRRVIKKLK